MRKLYHKLLGNLFYHIMLAISRRVPFWIFVRVWNEAYQAYAEAEWKRLQGLMVVIQPQVQPPMPPLTSFTNTRLTPDETVAVAEAIEKGRRSGLT